MSNNSSALNVNRVAMGVLSRTSKRCSLVFVAFVLFLLLKLSLFFPFVNIIELIIIKITNSIKMKFKSVT